MSLNDHIFFTSNVIEFRFPLIISIYDSLERALIIFTDIIIISTQYVATVQCSAIKTLEPGITVDAK